MQHHSKAATGRTRPPSPALAALVLALTLCYLPGTFAAAAAAPSPFNAAAPVLPPANGVAGAAGRSFTFRQLGAKTPLQLRGVQAYYTLPFAVRADEVVSQAALHIKYNWSPSLLEEVSHLNVRINDEVVATLPLPKAQAGATVESDVEIPPQLVSEFSRIGLELVGHYAKGCEDPVHSSLWAAVSNDSTLQLQVARIDKPNELGALPEPFFDRRDVNRLKIPFVLMPSPDLRTLSAAGTVASWFGSLAGYRGAQFPSLPGLPTQGNAVVMAVGDAPIIALGIRLPGGTLTGPVVAVVTHPQDAHAKVLVIAGRSAEELQTASTALATGGRVFSGERVTIKELAAPRARKPYDAPNWLPVDRPVRFGELVAPDLLGVAGESPDLIRVAFQLPPDLFGWRSRGIPLDLRYRYSPRPAADRSTLNVNLNQRFLQSIPLQPTRRTQVTGFIDRLLPGAVAALASDPASAASERLYIPMFTLPVHNQLQFHYYYDKPKQDTCHTVPTDNVRAGVDPDSSLDISSFPHYLEMPDLAAFANSGFPFTRMADLSESAIVLPTDPAPQQINLYLALMGRMGAATGYPAHGVTLVHPDTVDTVADKDLLLIGSGADQPLLKHWEARLPIALDGAMRRVRLSDTLYRLANGDIDRRQGAQPANGLVAFSTTGTGGMIAGFESPLHAGRSVVVVASDRPEGLDRVVEALLDPEKLKAVQGSATLVRDDRVESVVADESYFVGHLPATAAVHWFFSRHPSYMALASLAAVGALSCMAYLLLRDRARRRLGTA